MELLPTLTGMLLWLQQAEVNWSEFWVGVVIGWILLVGVLGYVYMVVRHDQ